MPEYLAPGVYVEETSFRQKTIEGVSTSTAGFVGPTRFGPVAGEPELLTSFLDFERIYGGIDPLVFSDHGETPNDLAHAVRGFFENGGRRLYVARTYAGPVAAGCASGTTSGGLRVRARHPGAAGAVTVSFTVKAGQNVLAGGTLTGVSAHDTVLVLGVKPELYWLEDHIDPAAGLATFRLRRPGDRPEDAPLVQGISGEVIVLTVTVTVTAMGRFMEERTWEDLAPDPRHRRDPLLRQFAAVPTRRATELFSPIVVEPASSSFPAVLDDGVSVLDALLADFVDATSEPDSAADVLRDHLFPPAQSMPLAPRPVQVRMPLRGGGDGARPGVAAYEGDGDDLSGLVAFEGIEDISIVAAPGSTRAAMNGRQSETASIQQLLLGHCERMRYRVAVLDPPDGALVSDIRGYRATMDSTRGALYYPWITIVDPLGGQELTTPPSGFVAGIYARTDVERGVHKSPANEVVRLAVGFEQMLNKAQQDVLNPEGVNCLRFFEGRGLRVWGARTATSDPEWRYVAVRRFFAFLEHSIDRGTQWAVFEPNGSVLWGRVRRTIEDFLADQWRSGHLMGDKPDEAYFVRCDRSTMTQSDFDNGRLVCLIGVAPLRPAEFVIFRIGQKTLDSVS